MPEDFVPKSEMNVKPFDFTQVDESIDNPIDNEVDLDSMNIDSNILQGVTDKDIEKGAYRVIPPGIHEVEILSVEFEQKGKEIAMASYVKDANRPNGFRSASYDSRKVTIRFCLPGDENCQVQDRFILPPDTNRPFSLDSYERGFADSVKAVQKKDADGGWHAKKWKHFLSKIFGADANGKMPPEAAKPSNWLYYPGTKIHRRIKLEVTPPEVGKPYPKKDERGNTEIDPSTGNPVMVTPTKAYSGIKMYSYASALEPPELVKMRHAEATRVPAPAQNGGAGMPAKDKKKSAV